MFHTEADLDPFSIMVTDANRYIFLKISFMRFLENAICGVG
jgi:hypothetical protein